MSDIGKGDWVEALEANRLAVGLRAGGIYRVAEVKPMLRPCGGCGPAGTVCARVGVRLECVKIPEPWPPFVCSQTLRPIYRPKASVIEALKAPVTRTPQVVKPIREGQKVNAQ